MLTRITMLAVCLNASVAVAQDVRILRDPEPELSQIGLSPEMKAARASFSIFVEELRDSPWDAKPSGPSVVTAITPDNPGNDDCCHQVKVLIPVGVGFETVWVTNVSITGQDQFVGVMQYAIGIASLSAGDKIQFGAAHVADWSYSLYEQKYGDFIYRSTMDPPPVAKFLQGDYAPLP